MKALVHDGIHQSTTVLLYHTILLLNVTQKYSTVWGLNINNGRFVKLMFKPQDTSNNIIIEISITVP